MTKALYNVATIGFVFGGVAWSASAVIGGNLLYGVLAMSNLCLGATFFVLRRGTTDEETSGAPEDRHPPRRSAARRGV